jgi:hypothetical protein
MLSYEHPKVDLVDLVFYTSEQLELKKMYMTNRRKGYVWILGIPVRADGLRIREIDAITDVMTYDLFDSSTGQKTMVITASYLNGFSDGHEI